MTFTRDEETTQIASIEHLDFEFATPCTCGNRIKRTDCPNEAEWTVVTTCEAGVTRNTHYCNPHLLLGRNGLLLCRPCNYAHFRVLLSAVPL